MLPMSLLNLLKRCLAGGHCCSVDIQFHRREGLKKALHDVLINRIGRNALTYGNMVLLSQRIAEIAGAMLVLDHHFVPTRSTVDDPMQERCPITRHPTRFVAIIGCVVVGKHILDVFKRFPRNVSGVDIIDANLPLCHRQANFLRVRGGGIFAYGASFSIDKGSGVGRIFQDLQDGSNGGLLPDDITKPIGSNKASSPRCALLSSPAVIRARMVCNSSSESCPFNLRTNGTVCCISGSTCHDPGRGESRLRAKGSRSPCLLASRGALGGPPLSEWSPALLTLALDRPSHARLFTLRCQCATVPGSSRPTDPGRACSVCAVSCRPRAISQAGRERKA